jgi:hypothetical protein
LAEAEAGRLPLLLPVPDWPLASPGPPHLHCICIASKICFAGESGGLDGFNFRLLETRLDAFRGRAPRANDFIPELGTVCPGTNPVCFVTVCGKTARRTDQTCVVQETRLPGDPPLALWGPLPWRRSLRE